MIGREGGVDDRADLPRSGGVGEEQLLLGRRKFRGRAGRPAKQIIRGASEDFAEFADRRAAKIKLSKFIF